MFASFPCIINWYSLVHCCSHKYVSLIAGTLVYTQDLMESKFYSIIYYLLVVWLLYFLQ